MYGGQPVILRPLTADRWPVFPIPECPDGSDGSDGSRLVRQNSALLPVKLTGL